jgi:hypothetical protein
MENIEAVCIKGDIIGSRKIGKEIQLKSIAKELNNIFEGNILTDFTVRFGDELFGVVNDFEVGYKVFRELFFLSREYKVPLYVGVGFGNIINRNLKNPDDVNGQAIWNSADALEFLQLSTFRGKSTIQSLDKNFKFMIIIGNNNPDSSIVNYMLYFILEKIKKRTDKQSQAIRLLEQHPKLNYEQLGKYLDYGAENVKANVSNLLKRAEYNIVKDAEEELVKLINLVYSGEK